MRSIRAAVEPAGHLSEPNEQNTQQSPDFGRSSFLQLVHS